MRLVELDCRLRWPLFVAGLVLGSTIALVGGLALTNGAAADQVGFSPAPVVPLVSQAPARLIVDAPLPDQLALGRVVVRYRTENLRIMQVFGSAALAVSPRIGHLHVTVDDAPWHWLDASGEPVIMNGLLPGRHKLLIELADPNHKIIDKSTINFEIPQRKAPDPLLKEAQGHFKPLPKDMGTAEFPVTPDRVELGRMLFFDPRISVDGTVSCARCHLSSLYATDGLTKSHGPKDQLAPRNAPTVLNAALHFKQHWTGDIENVEEQAKGSLLGGFGNPNYSAAMARVTALPGYAEKFKKVFPGEANPVTADNWGKAIGAYERTLVTPSRFDEYLGGKDDALSVEERKGLRTFIDTGCASCHNGAGVGGGKFRKFGVKEDYWKATGSKAIDRGRIDSTKDPADLHVFKVAGLRNVEMTPPYFHDGSVGTLPEAVRIMARVQLGKNLSDEDTASIVTFLKSLTGNLPENFANNPVLPAAGFRLMPFEEPRTK